MISQQKHNNYQSGISLMLAVLILASITAIALSLATIVLIEVRSSTDLKRTEPNLYATMGLTEMALFQYKRGVDPALLDINRCGGNDPGWWCATSNNVNLSVNSLSTYDMPRIVVLPSNTTLTIPMYFKANEWNNRFTQIELKPISSLTAGQVLVNFNEIPQSPANPDSPVTRGQTISLEADYTESGFSANSQYEIEIKNTTDEPKTIAIYSYETVGEEEKALGLPYLGNKVFEVVAKSFGLTRVYRVQIPIP